jgi:hypothetical protein
VADDPPRRDLRVLEHHVAAEARERRVLAGGEVVIGVPDQLDADGEVVAAPAPAPAAGPGVVGGPVGRDELRDAAVSVDEKVRESSFPATAGRRGAAPCRGARGRGPRRPPCRSAPGGRRCSAGRSGRRGTRRGPRGGGSGAGGSRGGSGAGTRRAPPSRRAASSPPRRRAG